MPDFKYRVFISYSHEDIGWARWCQRALETFRLPRRLQREAGCPDRVGKVFRDTDELGLASDLSETIRAALAESEFLLVVCSPAAGRSPWVNREVAEFQRLGRDARIFCLLVDGDPSDEGCLPESLRNREHHAPLFVDPRPAGDGKRIALMRVVASLLQLDFGRLQDRAARRRQNRLLGMTAVALVAVAVTSSLAFIAVVERQRAESQARIAEQSLSFMLDVFRVSDPSEARGNTVTARELLDRASDRIADELADDADARITLMSTIATVYTNLGLYRRAIELLEGSLQAREITETGGTLEAAQTLTELATAYHHLGEYAEAIGLHEQALEIRRRLGASDADIAHSLDNIGAAHYFRDAHAEARRYMTEALELRRRISPEMTMDIATSLNNLGALSSELGDLKSAIAYQREAYDAYRAIAGEDHQRTLIVLNNLALDMREHGLLGEVVPIYERLIRHTEKIHTPPHPDLANVYNNYGIYLLESGEPGRALEYFEQAATQWAATLGDEHHRTMTAEAYTGMALYYLDDLEAARERLTETLARQREALGSHSTMVTSQSALALVLYAMEKYEEGLALAEGAYETARERWPLNPSKQAIYRSFVARGLSHMGDAERALALYQEGHADVRQTYGELAYKRRRYDLWMSEAAPR